MLYWLNPNPPTLTIARSCIVLLHSCDLMTDANHCRPSALLTCAYIDTHILIYGLMGCLQPHVQPIPAHSCLLGYKTHSSTWPPVDQGRFSLPCLHILASEVRILCNIHTHLPKRTNSLVCKHRARNWRAPTQTRTVPGGLGGPCCNTSVGFSASTGHNPPKVWRCLLISGFLGCHDSCALFPPALL